MATPSDLKRLGQLIRHERKRKGWTLADMEERCGVRANYASNIERGYVNPKRGPVTPSDDILSRLAGALDIPLADLHAALGRAPAAELAASLVREKLAAYGAGQGGDVRLSDEELDRLIGDLEQYAEFTVGRMMRQMEKQEQPA